MHLDWPAIDRWLMGEAWTGSRLADHLHILCRRIGPRWATSPQERRAAEYIRDQLDAAGLEESALEEFAMDSWAYSRAEARLLEDGTPIDVLPFNYCPAFQAEGPIVDVGYGTPREIDRVRGQLPGGVAIMALAYEPFTEPVPHVYRLGDLARAGAQAAFAVELKDGRRMEYHNAADWRDPGPNAHPLPTVVTSREHGALLQSRPGERVRLEVDSRYFRAPSQNVDSQLTGSLWPGEELVLGGHHDTVYGAPGGNDNASGTIAVLEAARVLAGLRAATGVGPGRTIRFATYSAEEQKFQGSTAYVQRHYGGADAPSLRLAINLDELSTGPIKGVVLAFAHLRDLVQRQLDDMADGLQCHVMSQLDPSSDHFPFLEQGLDAAHLWRWRFAGRHADANFHHEAGDTADKLNARQLKEYVGQLARLLLRLSHLPPQDWPTNPESPASARARLDRERGSVVRVF